MPAVPDRVDVCPLIRFMLTMVSLAVVTIHILSAGQDSRVRLFWVSSLDLRPVWVLGRTRRVSTVMVSGIDCSPRFGVLCFLRGGRGLSPGLLLARLMAGRHPLMLL